MPQAKKNKSKARWPGPTRSAGSTGSKGSTPARTARHPAPRFADSPAAIPPPAIPPGLISAKASRLAIPPGANASSGLVQKISDYATLVPPEGVQPEDQAAAEPDDLSPWAAKATEDLLTVSYWLDPGETGDPFSATIRFTGRRTDVAGQPQPLDSFSVEQAVHGIIPGSGLVAVTAEIRGVNAGQWSVTARPAPGASARPHRPYPPPVNDQAAVPRVPWPRRVTIPTEPAASVHTATLLRTKVPGVVRYAYAPLVCTGVLAGLGLEALLLSHGRYSLLRPMVFSAIAIVAGVIGSKGWYVVVHRGRKSDGWCIQGFVAGAAVVVAAAALAGPGIPAGAFLAAAAPALLIGISIGRPGCFWAGCCTGRPTAARWGIWSSDRKVGCRRAPAQLLEALAALVSGVAVLAVVLTAGLARSGPAAVAGLACYTLCRQFILGLRTEPRVWPSGRVVTGTIAALVLITGVILLVRS
ncbi:MAG: prolipoprotein diacylglyceryl transferase family protein [Streptosporangiaceae bacterium]